MTASKLVPGILLVTGAALLAYLAAPFVRAYVAVDATFLALLLGLAIGAATRHPAPFEPGAQATLKRALLVGVVLLGVEVNLAFLAEAGPKGVLLAAVLIALTLAAFWLLARALRVEGDTWALLGAGTAICGLGAVAAAGASLKSREHDIAVAVAGVGILSAVGLLLYPLLGALLQLSPQVYGAWSGMSVHAVANAVAAGFAFGDEAGRVATLTKLTRVALLAPALVAITWIARREARAEAGSGSLLPPMVWGFLAVALAAIVLPLPERALAALKLAAKLFLILGMAALGYTTRLGHVRKAGPRGLALAVSGWLVLSVAALAGAMLLYG